MKANERKPWGLFIQAGLLHVLTAMWALAMAYVLKESIDQAVAGEMKAFFRVMGLGILVMLGSAMTVQLGRKVLLRYAKLSLQALKSRRFAYLCESKEEKGDVAEFSSNVELIYNNYYMNQGLLVLLAAQFLFTSFGIIYLSWKVAIVTFIAVFLPLLAPLIWQKKMQESTMKFTEEQGRYLGFISDVIQGVKELRAYQAIPFFQKKHQEADGLVEEARMRSKAYLYASQNFGNMFGSMSIIAIMAACGYLTIIGEVTIGTVVAVMQMSGQIVQPVMHGAHCIGEMKSVAALEKRYRTEGPERALALPAERSFVEAIRVDKLGFAYGENSPVIENFSYTFERGKSYLIEGASGTGKSTLAKILGGELAPQVGTVSVMVNGHSSPIEACPSCVHYVAQEPYLFAMPVRDNISLGQDLEKEKLKALTEKLKIQSLLNDDLRILANRDTVSGGQKQRIVLSRALLHEAPVLILDEPTANVDASTAAAMMEAVQEGAQEILIVIAHQVSADFRKRFDERIGLEEVGETRVRLLASSSSSN